MAQADLDANAVLSYLGLPKDHIPSPTDDPIAFLSEQIRYLPPNILSRFSSLTTPKQRTNISTIRNRRLKYTESNPAELDFVAAKSSWPTLWLGREPRGREEGKEEHDWAQNNFLEGKEKHVGKLGVLLSMYEEEREAEKVRTIRRQEAEAAEALPEEDSESESESEESELDSDGPDEGESPAVAQALFLRRIKERFIYGLLDVSSYFTQPSLNFLKVVRRLSQSIDYDRVDWDEQWDAGNDRDEEERWFDDEEECTLPNT